MEEILMDKIVELSKRIGVLERDNEILKADNEKLRKQIEVNSNTSSFTEGELDELFEKAQNTFGGDMNKSESTKKTKRVLKKNLL